jgi:very-short-patch-repair endonuclease
MKTMEDVLATLESMGFPDGRTLKFNKELMDDIKSVTEFLPDSVKLIQRLQCIENQWESVPTCEVCGNPNVFSRKKLYGGNYSGWSKCCCKECSNKSSSRMERTRKTMMERYGVEFSGQSKELLEKKNKTMLERYGAEYYLQTNNGIDEFKKTMLSRHGVEWGLQSREIYKKAQETWVKNHGVLSPMLNQSISKKRLETWNKKYNGHPMQNHYDDGAREVLFDSERLKEHYEHFKSTEIASKDIGVSSTTYKDYLKKYGIDVIHNGAVSAHETEIGNLIESWGFDVDYNNRKILNGKESDIVVHDKKLIIEFNGLYWHSDIFKEKTFHQKKSILAHQNGYSLIHVWEDDWIYKRDIVIKKIKAKLGKHDRKIYARKCDVRVINNDLAVNLYNENHIQGHINAKIVYGLYFNNELVGAMSVKKQKDGSFDIVRFATACTVVGGFSKLLKFFIKQVNPKKIVTFASLDYSNGNVYEKNGFALVNMTRPNYWYSKGGVRYARTSFMKHKLHKKLKTFDENMTEYENMTLNGFVRIHDAGSLKFEMIPQ